MLGFLARLVGLPFRPALWRASAEQSWLAVVLPLFALVLIADTAIGLVYAERSRAAIYRLADLYAANADVLVFENGKFSLSGPRIFRATEGDFTILLDPASTVPESELTTDAYLVVREDRVILRGRTQTRVIEAADYADPERFVLDAVEVRSVADEVVWWTLLVLFAGLRLPFDLVACGVYALLAGALLHVLRGQRMGLSFAACVKIGLATCAATALLEVVLELLGISVPLPVRPLVWLGVATGLGFVALAAPRPAPQG
jgi:hypothetical protein